MPNRHKHMRKSRGRGGGGRMATYDDPFHVSARQTVCSSQNRRKMREERGHNRKTAQDHRNTVALVMEECSERELLRETYFERRHASASLGDISEYTLY